ncbi:transposase [Geobacter sp.]|uniref:transposase n=1 Tax=Geobacter sp. TaxID=46610 RepID=UPI0026301661|nr:transposase [Geobacter sp.]
MFGVKENSIIQSLRRGKFTQIRQVDGNGKGRGGKVWQVHITDPAIPEAKRAQWLLAHAQTPAETVCALPVAPAETAVAVAAPKALPAVATLKKWQRDTMDARIVFLRLVERAEATGIGVTRAIRTLVTQARHGALPPEAQGLVPLANKRSGTDTKKRTLSERSLMRWWSEWNKGGKQAGALAPKDVEKTDLPPWAPNFLQCYQVPQKISVAHALEDLAAILPAGVPMPSEHQARRFIAKYSKLEIQKGRMTGKEFKSLKGFVRRDTSKFEPLDICLCDGHSFKAKVAHPVHGRPFKPEVCAIIDAVTRVCIGWSAGLAESSQTVADAYRHAVTVTDQKRYGGIPAILYADKGAGNEAKANSDPFFGMYARVGSSYKTGIPGNSQARGLIERMQGSLWIRAAKKLITYTGRGMDEQVQRKVYLTMERDVKKALKEGKEGKKSELLLSWQEFLDFCAAEVEEYNRRPHKGLPRITDPQTGLRRNMCPLEMWSKFLADGWSAEVPDSTELGSLFRPHVTVTTRRGEVRLFGNIYYAPELVHYTGQSVIVAYDVHDASQVWVKDGDERLICVARFEANKKDFYPVSAVEKAREERLSRRKKLKELQIAEIEAEACPAIETAPAVIELPPETAQLHQELLARARGEVVDDAPFLPADDYEAWLKLREEAKAGLPLTDQERQWITDYEETQKLIKPVGLVAQGFDPFGERYRLWLEKKRAAQNG